MALKFKYPKREEIPAEHLPFYAEREGAWQLDIDGVVDKAKLDEFRQTNVTLLKQLEEQRKRFEGIDPEAVREAIEAKRKLDEGELLKRGDFDSVLLTRLAPLEKRAKEAEASAAAANTRLVDLQINQGVVQAAAKRGVRATASPDLTARARGVFRLVNGVPAAFEGDGVTPLLGKDRVSPMSFEEWTEVLATEAPHLFESNAGSGAAGGLASGLLSGGERNPWRKGSWNLTEQMRIQRTDPKRAEQLKAAAS